MTALCDHESSTSGVLAMMTADSARREHMRFPETYRHDRESVQSDMQGCATGGGAQSPFMQLLVQDLLRAPDCREEDGRRMILAMFLWHLWQLAW